MTDATSLCLKIPGLAIESDEIIFLPYTIPGLLRKRKMMTGLMPLSKRYIGVSHSGCLDCKLFGGRDKKNFSKIKSMFHAWITAENTDYFLMLDRWRQHESDKRAKVLNSEKREKEYFFRNIRVFLGGRREGDSYNRFTRDVDRLVNLGVDMGDKNHSVHFVDECVKCLASIIRKVLTETFCKIDPLTQARPNFWISFDGLTAKRKSG